MELHLALIFRKAERVNRLERGASLLEMKIVLSVERKTLLSNP